MTIPVLKIKVLPKPTIKGKMDVRFPANVETQNFLTVSKSNGTYTFGVDYSVLTPGPIADPTTAFIAIQDETSGVYRTVSLASLLTSGLDADIQAIAALTGTGVLSRTAAGTWALRTITGTANEITVTNGDGVAGNETISLPNALTFTGKTVTGGTFNSPALTGTPTAPTAAIGTNTTQIATTAFVLANAAVAGVPLFDSASAAAAASSSTAHLIVVDEDAQAAYSYDPSTSSAATITNAAGRKYRNIEKVLTPKMFGAVGDGVTDDTAALQALAAEINWRGGSRVEFGDSKTYSVWNTVPANGSSLMSLSSIKKTRMNFNGSSIAIPVNFATNNIVLYIMPLANVEDVHIDHPNFVQTVYNAVDSAKGCQGIYVSDLSRGIEIHDYVQNGGVSGLSVVRFARNRARDIFMSGDFQNVYYPATFQRNGDQVELRYQTRGAGRSYFPYNVRQHTVVLNSQQDGPFDDCLLKVYANPGESNAENTLADINLRYINVGRATAVNPGGSLIRLGMDQFTSTPAPGFIRNIKIVLDVDTGAPGQPAVIATSKTLSNGASDTVARGHLISNIEISGYINAGAQSTTCMELFTNNGTSSTGDFSGDTVESVVFRDFSQYGPTAPFNINSACIDRNFKFENVYVEGTVGLGTLPQKLIDVSDNVILGAIRSFNESGTPGSAGYTGYRRLPNGGLEIWGLTTATGSANTAVSFPVAFTAIPTVTCSSTAGGTTSPVNAVSATTAGFSINNPGTTVVVAWRAVGYI